MATKPKTTSYKQEYDIIKQIKIEYKSVSAILSLESGMWIIDRGEGDPAEVYPAKQYSLSDAIEEWQSSISDAIVTN